MLYLKTSKFSKNFEKFSNFETIEIGSLVANKQNI